MGKILIRNADIVTLNEGGDILLRTDLTITGDRITSVGNVPADFVPDEIIDATDHVLMPGFFNCHTHSPMTFERGWAEDLPFDRWLNEKIWVAESALTPEDVRWGAYLAAAEMIRSGTVGFADHYFYMDEVAEVVEEAGLKALLAWCVFGMGADTEVGTDLEGSIDFIERWQGAGHGRIKTTLGPHSPYACPPEFLRTVMARARELELGLHLHVAEFPEQRETSLRKHGLAPIAYLEKLGILDVPVIAAHAIYVDDEDLAILAKHEVTVVQCPTTHMKLGMGVTRVPEMLAAGVNVALGTDGPASGNALDMLREVQLAVLLQRHALADPTALPGDLPLRLASQRGAQAMGFSESGVVAPGRSADLILLDFRHAHLRPRHNLLANVIFAAKSPDIRYVIVDGQILLRDGKLTTLDEDRILHEAEQRAFRMVGQEMRIVRAYET